MRYALYGIWFAFPAVFLLIALWGWLENRGKSERFHDVKNTLRQGGFVLVAALLALALDRYVLLPHLESALPDWLPLGVIEVALFPSLLLLLACIVGPSSDVTISSRTPRHPGGR